MRAEQAAALADAMRHVHHPKGEGLQQRSAAGGGAVEVTAGRAALREATLVAIDDAGERLSHRCTSLLRGEGSLAEVSAELEAIQGLLDIHRRVQPGSRAAG